MDRVKEQIKKLDIPYPQRHLLELEVCQDLEHDPDSYRGDVQFSREALNELETIHATSFHRFLKRSGKSRRTIETSLAFLPLALGLLLIMEEKEVIDFIREGGIGMYGILAIGMLLLGKEVLNAIRLVIAKDHSARNLRIDTPSVLLGCLALMLASFGSTILGVYVSADAVMRSHLSNDLLMAGAKESLTNIVLSSFLCAVIILAHYATRRMLHIWHAPLAD